MNSSLKTSGLLILTVFAISATQFIYGQTQTQFDRGIQSPTAASLGEYGADEPNLHRGMANVSIPLYTLISGDIEVLITLQHSNSGFKVEEIPGWVGHGWNLNAGGVITRTVNGLPDDKPTYGFLDTGDELYKTSNVDWTANSVDQLYVEKIYDGYVDSEPDVFYFNFQGYSGSFIFYVDQSDSIRIRMTEEMPFSITYQVQNFKISSFTIRDANGFRYIFNDTENTITETTVEDLTSGDVLLIPDNDQEYYSSWYLSKIVSENTGYVVEFDYINYSGAWHDRLGSEEWIKRGAIAEYGMYTSVKDKHDYKLLTSIAAKSELITAVIDEEVTFSVSGRADFNQERKLDEMKHYINGQLSSGFSFAYDTLGSGVNTSRLLLEEVTRFGSDQSTLPGWGFTYYPGSDTYVPPINSQQVDHWGYYNCVDTNEPGIGGNSTLLPVANDSNGNPLRAGVGDDRDPDHSCAKKGMLESITYPTGGSTTFYYEGNRVNVLDPGSTNYVNQQISDSLDNTSGSFNSNTNFTIAGDEPSVLVDATASIPSPAAVGECTEGDVSCEIDPVDACLDAEIWIEDDAGNLEAQLVDGQLPIYLTVGNYKLFISRADTDCELGATLSWTEANIFSGQKLLVDIGGLRLKRTVDFDGISTDNNIARLYNYYSKSDTTLESSYLPRAPKFYHEFQINSEDYKILASNSLMPIGVAPNIGYNEVKETIVGANSGYIWHFFSANMDTPSENFELGPYTNLGVYRGKLLRKEFYNSSNNIVRKIEDRYSYLNVVLDTLPSQNIHFYRAIKLKNLASLVSEQLDPTLFIGDGTASFYSHYKIWMNLTEQILTEYDPDTGEKVSTQIEYNYDDYGHKQLTSKVETDTSNSQSRITEYVYAHEVYTPMKEQHRLSQKYSVTLKEASKVRSKNWTEWDEWEYIRQFTVQDSHGQDSTAYDTTRYWFPGSIRQWKGSNSTDTTASYSPDAESILVAKVNKYYKKGMPHEVEDYLGNTTRYFYGSTLQPYYFYMNSLNHEVGVSLGNDLTGIVNIQNGEDGTTCTGDDLCTSAIYDSFGRITSVTSPNGVTPGFTYDSFSRLDTMKNDAGQAITHYDYTYTGSLFSATNPNWIEADMYDGTNTRTSRSYLDGLGRGIQSVTSNGAGVIITANKYDSVGRAWKTFKPYSGTGLAFKSNYESGVQTAYGNAFAFVENTYEQSPLNRHVEIIPMGGKTTYGSVTTAYSIETLGSDTYQVITTTDPVGNVTKTYTDGWGQTKRTVADSSGINAITEFDYDVLGRLLEVRPPNYFAPPGGSVAADWVITYGYDILGNLLSKTSSDFGTVQYAYDSMNRLRFSQDANQAAAGQVAYTSYDELGRVTKTGVADYSGSFASLDADTVHSFEVTEAYQKGAYAYDAKPSVSSYPWSEFSSEIAAFTMDTSLAKGQLVADMYRFGPEPLEANLDTSGLGISGAETYRAIDTLTIGVSDALAGSNVLLEAGRSIVIKDGFTAFNGSIVTARIDTNLAGTDSVGISAQTGTSPWQLQLYSYDSEGRVAQKKILTGSRRDWDASITYTYNRLGEVTVQKTTIGGQSLYHHYTYNQLGQLTAFTLTTDGTVDTEVPEIEYSYTADGQVEERKYQGGTVTDYTYDIQSRLEQINDPGVNTHPFSADYTYFNNGNIKDAEFRNPLTSLGASHQRYKYTHTYDKLNRLTSAIYSYHTGTFWILSTDAFKVGALTYDKQGNLTSLTRYDENLTQIDDLSYQYSTSNRLNSIIDTITETTTIGWDAEDATFGYDTNGNMTSQSGKFTKLVYNEFNLPLQVETQSGDLLKANYNGAGHRILKEFIPASGGSTHTYYVRDGDRTLATVDQDDKVDFNLYGLGMEGQRGKVILSGLFESSYTVTSESEPNNTQATADGRVYDGGWAGGVYGILDFHEYDWYYFDINGDGTVSYTLDASSPPATSTVYEFDIYDPQSSKVVDESGQLPLSGSFQARAGRYYMRVYSYEYTSGEDYKISLGGTLDADQQQSRFFIKDHLGSTRAVVQDNGTHLASYDYYPFGLEMPGRSASTQSTLYKFTGHERDEESGINIDYMLARGYDPAIARFMQVDPLADQFPHISTYAYGNDNPLRFTDPTGMSPYDWIRNNETGQYTWDWNVTSSEDTPEGYTYVGKGRDDINADYKENTSLLGRIFGSRPDIDWNSIGAVVKEYNASDYVSSISIADNPGSLVIGGPAGSVRGASWLSKLIGSKGVTNPIPSKLVRVIPGNITSKTLGAPGAKDVFVTAADDIIGMNASQIANRLTIPSSSYGFKVIEFNAPRVGLASPINRTNPGFVGFGRTVGGAREFVIPNQVIPSGSTIKIIK